MSKTNHTKYVILGLLLESPMSGYDVKKWTEASIAYFWDLSYGQIYPTLKKMENEGLVSMEIDDDGDGPRKKVYSITTEGRKFFCNWMKDAPADDRYKSENTLKLFFGNSVSPDVSIENLNKYREYQFKNLELMNSIKKKIMSFPESDFRFYKLLTVNKGISVYSASIAWADETIDLINNRSFDNSQNDLPAGSDSCI